MFASDVYVQVSKDRYRQVYYKYLPVNVLIQPETEAQARPERVPIRQSTLIIMMTYYLLHLTYAKSEFYLMATNLLVALQLYSLHGVSPMNFILSFLWLSTDVLLLFIFIYDKVL